MPGIISMYIEKEQQRSNERKKIMVEYSILVTMWANKAEAIERFIVWMMSDPTRKTSYKISQTRRNQQIAGSCRKRQFSIHVQKNEAIWIQLNAFAWIAIFCGHTTSWRCLARKWPTVENSESVLLFVEASCVERRSRQPPQSSSDKIPI